ncbi:MAG: hypothetical protein J6W17_01755, partial [Campylobacter sp.]|nr:hypothetical protein [Campylobacter sp.]
LYDIIDSRITGIKVVGRTYWSLILAPIAILAAIVYVLYENIGYLFELALAYISAYWLVASIAVVLIYVLFRLKFIGLGLFALLCGAGWYFANDVTPYVDALVDKSSQARIAYLKSNKYSILHETKKALSQDNKSVNLSNREKTIQIQRILIKNGYKLKADGVFGKKTISAAKKFTGLNSADLNTLYIAVKNKADGKKN